MWKLWWMKNISVACVQSMWAKICFFSEYGGCYSHSQCCHALTPSLQPWPPPTTTTEVKQAAINTCMQTQVSVFPRFPWFLQFLHWRDITGGPRAAGDGAELCFCFWHSGQEAHEEVASYTDYELHQPAGGWDPLLWPAHLYQAPRPWERAVLRPRALQCHGQHRVFWCDEFGKACGWWAMFLHFCVCSSMRVQSESLIMEGPSVTLSASQLFVLLFFISLCRQRF